jgi:hypothetical protein
MMVFCCLLYLFSLRSRLALAGLCYIAAEAAFYGHIVTGHGILDLSERTCWVPDMIGSCCRQMVNK